MDQAGSGYAGVGATLRVARERTGADAAAVAKALRMQAGHLSAIEQGRFGELPGQVYAIGFVRSYAEYLGFDGDAAVRRLKEEMSGEAARQSPLTFPVPVGEARTPGPRLLLFAVVAAAAIYGAWVYWGRVQTGVLELVPPLPERLAKLLGDTPAPAIAAPSQPAPTPAQPAASPAPTPAVPAPPAPTQLPSVVASAPAPAVPTVPARVPVAPAAALAPPPEVAQPTPAAAAAPAPAATPAALPVPAPALPAPPPLVAAAPVGAEVVPPAPPRPPVQAEAPQAVAALPVPPSFPTVGADPAATMLVAPTTAASGNVYGVAVAESRVTLRAKSISWVQVRGADNEILITRTLRAGDVYHLPNRADMVMMTGSAGGLEVLVDGKPVPPLGAAGEVRRNIPLDPEKLARLGTPSQ